METKDQNQVEIEAKELKQEEATEHRAMKIRLKTGIRAGLSQASQASAVNNLIVLHL